MDFTQIDRLGPLEDELVALYQDELVALYQNEWWTVGRTPADVRRMLEHSLVVAFRDADGHLAAFARVLTDFVYKALVLDVIVAPAHRGSGLGRRLVDAVIGHAQLRDVRHFELYCRPEMVALYERWGFTTEIGGTKFMRLERSPQQPGREEGE